MKKKQLKIIYKILYWYSDEQKISDLMKELKDSDYYKENQKDDGYFSEDDADSDNAIQYYIGNINEEEYRSKSMKNLKHTAIDPNTYDEYVDIHIKFVGELSEEEFKDFIFENNLDYEKSEECGGSLTGQFGFLPAIYLKYQNSNDGRYEENAYVTPIQQIKKWQFWKKGLTWKQLVERIDSFLD